MKKLLGFMVAGSLTGLTIYILWLLLSLLSGPAMVFGSCLILVTGATIAICIHLKGDGIEWEGWLVMGIFLFVLYFTGKIFGLNYFASIGLPAGLEHIPGHGALYPILGIVYWAVAMSVMALMAVCMSLEGIKNKICSVLEDVAFFVTMAGVVFLLYNYVYPIV